MGNQAIDVVIIEDYKLTRLGLKSLLSQDQRIHVVGEAEDAETGIDLVTRLCPHVVVMDIGLPKMNGIQASQLIKKALPDTKIIMLTSHQEQQEVSASFEVGVDAYCLKDISAERLVEVIKSVHRSIHPVKIPLTDVGVMH